MEAVRVPLQNPDYAPYLQRARDAKPDALFVWVPGGLAAALMRQYAERGLNKSGIRLIGVGDITDDAVLNLWQAIRCSALLLRCNIPPRTRHQ